MAERMAPQAVMDYLESLDANALYQKLMDITKESTDARDETKGRLLAIEDFKAVLAAHQGQESDNLKNFLAKDVFVLTLLKMLIAESDQRKENVLSARARMYSEIQTEALKRL